ARDERRLKIAADQLDPLCLDSRVDDPQNRAQMLAVGGRDAALVRFAAGKVLLPECASAFNGRGNLAQRESIDAIDHDDIERLIDRESLGPRQRLGPGGSREYQNHEDAEQGPPNRHDAFYRGKRSVESREWRVESRE